MDIVRVGEARRRRIRRTIFGIVGLVVIALITVAVSRLKPADPTVERGTVWFDTVKRGPMVRQVRGLGSLVPEEIRWIPAVTDGRVEKILVHPGTSVTADTVILELSNPEQEQAAQEAQSQVQAAEARMADLRARLESDLLTQQATAAQVAAEYEQARLQARSDAELFKEGLQSQLLTQLSRVRAEQTSVRNELEKKRVAQFAEQRKAQIAAQQSDVDRLRAVLRLRQSQLASLKVRAGTDGMLQVVPVEVGQRVGPGTNLARVANPQRLKAELKVAETQAKDIQIGQLVSIDTRNGLIPGHVSRIDPAVQGGTVTVDAALDGPLPKGARPDLSVDGTIELERLDNVLYVGRPAYGQDNSAVQLFKLVDGGARAVRTKVTLGRASVNTVEIRDGLTEGDQVILSDMSQFDAFSAVRLR
jgi:HlyD family secretion protein